MKIGLFGCGAFGMALSSILIDNNCEIQMWTKFIEEKEQLEKERKNELFIPNFELSQKIKITTNIEECAKNKDLIIIAIPTAFIEGLIKELHPYIKEQHILIASKGISNKDPFFTHEIIEEYTDNKKIAVISGPSFAKDIVIKNPIGLTIASNNLETRKIVKKAFKNKYIKLEETTDILGVEICGAVKNIMAIGTGILSGLKSSESTKAAFFTKIIHNMISVLELLEADKNTILSFAGIGDLTLTCNSEKSRNFCYGKIIGEMKSKEEIEKYKNTNTIEGYDSLISIHELLNQRKINIPLLEMLYSIIEENKDPNELVEFILV